MSSLVLRGGRSKQRGGHLPPLHPAQVSGLGTPVITQHLEPGAITYNSNPADIQGQGHKGGRRSSSRTRRSSKRSSSKRSSSKRSSSKRSSSKKPFWGEYLARMSHPRGAVGGRSKRSRTKRSRTKRSSTRK